MADHNDDAIASCAACGCIAACDRCAAAASATTGEAASAAYASLNGIGTTATTASACEPKRGAATLIAINYASVGPACGGIQNRHSRLATNSTRKVRWSCIFPTACTAAAAASY